MALTTNAIGTNVSGETRRRMPEVRATSRIEKAAVAITMVGSDVTSRLARKSASRVALPAMNCALTAAAPTMAVAIAAPDGPLNSAMQPRP
jgi:hypothetical protein